MSNRVFSLAGLGCALACAAPPPPLVAPVFTTAVRHRTGSALTGVLPGRAAHQPLTLHARCSLRFTEQVPAVGTPLSQTVRATVRSGATDPLRGVSTLAIGARAADGPAARVLFAGLQDGQPVRSAEVAALDGHVAPGHSAAFLVRSAEAQQITLLVTATTADRARVDLQLAGDGSDADLDADLEAELGAGAPAAPTTDTALRRETVTLDAELVAGGDALLLLLPLPTGDASGALAVLLELARTSGDEHRAHRELARGQIAAETAIAKAQTAPLSPAEVQLQSLREACRLLQRTRARSALLQLAESAEAALTADLALMSDHATIQEYTERLLGGDRVTGLALAGPQFGYALEAAAYGLLAERLDREALAPELRAALLRHAGAAGRDPGALAAVLRGEPSVAGLQQRLLEENRFALEDSDLGARVTAVQWLQARHAAPTAFDPFGDREARREALDAARQRGEL